MTASRRDEMTFEAPVTVDRHGAVRVLLPFDPDTTWGRRPRHRVTGTADGAGLRATITPDGTASELVLGPAWASRRFSTGDVIEITIRPEGPQRDQLDPDIAAALDANPQAAAFFDGLAQFYRKQYLTWINATKRHPERRDGRIADVVALLEAGHKQRPGGRAE